MIQLFISLLLSLTLFLSLPHPLSFPSLSFLFLSLSLLLSLSLPLSSLPLSASLLLSSLSSLLLSPSLSLSSLLLSLSLLPKLYCSRPPISLEAVRCKRLVYWRCDVTLDAAADHLVAPLVANQDHPLLAAHLHPNGHEVVSRWLRSLTH